MIAVALYAILIGLGAFAAGAIMESPLRRSRGPIRFLWIGILAATAVVPVAIRRGSVDVAPLIISPVTSAGPTSPSLQFDPATGVYALPVDRRVSRVRLDADVLASSLTGPMIDRVAVWVAVVPTFVMIILFSLDMLRMRRFRRRCAAQRIDGVDALVSRSFGPAVIGVMTPSIVVPEWVLSLDADARALVLRHETEHVKAHDQRLLAAAYAIVAIAPWNPFLWLQVRRLRAAIETDCDRRVLTHEAEPRLVERYGALLIETAARTRASSRYALFTATALLEHRALLKQRIDTMTESATSLFRAGVLARATIAGLVVAAACSVRPPGPSVGPAETPATTMPTIAAYVGDSVAVDSRQMELTPQAVAAARDLPPAFVADPQYTDADRVCDSHLRDPRDMAQLLLLSQSYVTTEKVGRNSVASGVGYYFVYGPRRYGVAEGQVLRVGCKSTSTPAPEPAIAVSPVATELQQKFGERPTVKLIGKQLEITFQSALLGNDPTVAADSARAIARGVWQSYGEAAALERIVVGVPITAAKDGFTYSNIRIFSYSDRTQR